jgi:hypothetical protein
VTTIRHRRPPASLTVDPLWAALLGLVAGLSLASHLQTIHALLVLMAGG